MLTTVALNFLVLGDCLDQFYTGSQRTQSLVLAPGPRLSSTITTWAAMVILLA